jgi:hypothetical protein
MMIRPGLAQQIRGLLDRNVGIRCGSDPMVCGACVRVPVKVHEICGSQAIDAEKI